MCRVSTALYHVTHMFLLYKLGISGKMSTVARKLECLCHVPYVLHHVTCILSCHIYRILHHVTYMLHHATYCMYFIMSSIQYTASCHICIIMSHTVCILSCHIYSILHHVTCILSFHIYAVS
ncbi:hypothetical protein FKM82_003563 [Ascaphus truei]